MRSLPKLAAVFASLLSVWTPGKVLAQDKGEPGRVVLVLPFDNRSGNASLNWIGESFPETLDKRLDTAGFLTISHDDRVFALAHLGLPENFRPSRATSLRIAQQLDANYIVVGSYNVSGHQLTAQAQVFAVDALHMTPAVQDSAQLPELVSTENAVAWHVARTIDPTFAVSESTFTAAINTIPLTAFENYIRGVNAPTLEERLKRLKDAVAVDPQYSAALLALGKEQYTERAYREASTTLARVPKDDPLALEANFYLGLSRFNSTDYTGAEDAFAFLSNRLPLSEVVNNRAVALSRQGKDSVALFQRAVAQDPNSEDFHFNLAVNLFRRGETTAAKNEVEAALRLNPHDGEAAQLRSQLNLVPQGTRLTQAGINGLTPTERILRSWSETSFRQAAFQINQLRDARLAMLPPEQRAQQYISLGYEYLGQGLLPESERQFTSALATGQSSPEAHAGLAQLRERSGDTLGARQEALSSVQARPNATGYLVLARLDLAANQLSSAAGDTSHALNLEPNNSAALAMKQNLVQRGQAVP